MRRFVKPFIQISGGKLAKLNLISHIQTDGSLNSNISRTAVILIEPDGNKYTLSNTYFNHSNSAESDWRSIIDGLEFGLKKGTKNIQLENDNNKIINHLIQRRKPQAFLFDDYFDYIFYVANKLDSLEVRWIPKHLNESAKLFRIK